MKASDLDVKEAIAKQTTEGILQLAITLKGLTSAQVEEALHAFEQLPGHSHQEAFAAFAQEWGHLDPEGALLYVTNPKQRFASKDATTAALRGLARKQPARAIDLLEKHRHAKYEQAMRLGIIQGIADQDLDLATSVALAPNSPGNRIESLRQLAVQQAANPHEARRLLEALERQDPDGTLEGIALLTFAESAPYVPGLRRFLQNEAKQRDLDTSTLATMAGRFKQTFSDRLAWLESLESSSAAEAKALILDDWAAQAPNEAAQWLGARLSTDDSSTIDPLLGRFVQKIAKRDPDSAAAWAGMIEDQQLRQVLEEKWLPQKAL